MLIEKVILKNFRQYREAELVLDGGLTGILGPNGAGKSNLLSGAVLVGLYGPVASETAKDLQRRIGADGPCVIDLTFRIGPNRCHLIRDLEGDAALYVNDKIEAKGTAAVNRAVPRLLGMEWKSFLLTYLVRQDEVKLLSMLRANERRDYILRAAGIKRIDGAIDAVGKQARSIADRVDIQAATTGNLSEVEAAMGTAEKALATLQETAERCAREVDSAQKSLTTAEAILSGFEGTARAHQDVVVLRATAQADCRAAKERVTMALERLREAEGATADLDGLSYDRARLDALRAEIMGLEAARAALADWRLLASQVNHEREALARIEVDVNSARAAKTELEDLAGRLSHLTARLIDLESQRKDYAHRVETLAAEVSSAKTAWTRASEELASIEKIGPSAPCPACLRPLGADYESLKARLLEQIARAGSDKDTAEEMLKGLRRTDPSPALVSAKRDQSTLAERMRALERAAGVLPEFERKITETRASLVVIEGNLGPQPEFDEGIYRKATEERDRLDRVEATAIALEALASDLPNRQQEMQMAEMAAKDAEVRLAEHERRIAALSYVSADHSAAKELVEQRRTALHTAEQSLSRAHLDHQLAEREVSRLQTDLEKCRLATRELEELRNQVAILSETRAELATFRTEKMGRLRPSLQRWASELLAEISGGRLTAIQLDEDFEMTVLKGSREAPSLSGGESDLASLCLRIAMARLLGGDAPGILMLDEVFSSLDDQRRASLLQAIRSLKSRFPQIVLVEHEDSLKEAVDMIYEVRPLSDYESELIRL